MSMFLPGMLKKKNIMSDARPERGKRPKKKLYVLQEEHYGRIIHCDRR